MPADKSAPDMPLDGRPPHARRIGVVNRSGGECLSAIHHLSEEKRNESESFTYDEASPLRLVALGLHLVAMGDARSVSAAVVTGSLAFTATGFPGGAPVDPVSGRVDFSFDNSANFFNAANGTTQNGAPSR